MGMLFVHLLLLTKFKLAKMALPPCPLQEYAPPPHSGKSALPLVTAFFIIFFAPPSTGDPLLQLGGGARHYGGAHLPIFAQIIFLPKLSLVTFHPQFSTINYLYFTLRWPVFGGRSAWRHHSPWRPRVFPLHMVDQPCPLPVWKTLKGAHILRSRTDRHQCPNYSRFSCIDPRTPSWTLWWKRH